MCAQIQSGIFRADISDDPAQDTQDFLHETLVPGLSREPGHSVFVCVGGQLVPIL